MCPRVKIVLTIVSVVLVGVIVSQVLTHQGQPVYKGKPLTRWLRDYAMGSPAQRGEAAEAVSRIGTNAIPTLLQMLRAKDSAVKARVMNLLQRQRIIRIECTPANVWNGLGQAGFALLGAKGKSAVPALIEIADHNISLESRGHAVLSLGSIGPVAKEAVPALLRWGTNADQKLRLEAGVSLRIIDPESAKAGGTDRVSQQAD
jgi:hypothetical protein